MRPVSGRAFGYWICLASAAGVAVLLLTAASSCDTSGGTSGGSSPSSGGTAAVGQAVASNDGKQLTVVSFNPNFTGPSQFVDAGKKCITVVVDLKNGSSNDWTGIDINFNVIDNSGVKTGFGSGIGCAAPAGPDTLVAGGHQQATVAFEVSTAATSYTFEWQPSLLDTQTFDVPLT
jgi:hypothetical protein